MLYVINVCMLGGRIESMEGLGLSHSGLSAATNGQAVFPTILLREQ